MKISFTQQLSYPLKNNLLKPEKCKIIVMYLPRRFNPISGFIISNQMKNFKTHKNIFVFYFSLFESNCLT